MRICGCEISAQEVRLAVVELNGGGDVEMLRLKTTRIERADDTSEADLRDFLASLQEFARDVKRPSPSTPTSRVRDWNGWKNPTS